MNNYYYIFIVLLIVLLYIFIVYYNKEKEIIEVPICPPGFFGNIPYPNDCRSFILCTAGIGNVLNCNAGNYFNVEQSRCVPGDC